MNTELNGLLRAIVASPNDNTLRLIYADALDDSGEADRAQFIRLEVERFINGNQKFLGPGTPNAGSHSPAHELITKHGEEWSQVWAPFFRVPGAGATPRYREDYNWLGNGRATLLWRRGFPEELRTDLDTFYGRRCLLCALTPGGYEPTGCQRCGGDGRVETRRATTPFESNPILAVVLRGMLPDGGNGASGNAWSWHRAAAHQPRSSLASSTLPSPIWDCLPACQFAPWSPSTKSYSRQIHARRLLSAACIEYGKSLSSGRVGAEANLGG